jgi:hypothetical protein
MDFSMQYFFRPCFLAQCDSDASYFASIAKLLSSTSDPMIDVMKKLAIL